MCFLERHVSDLPLKEISTCVREIGAAAAASSPLPSFFFPLDSNPPALVCGGAAETAGRCFQATGGGAFWVFWAAGGREIFIRAEKRQQKVLLNFRFGRFSAVQ